MDQRVRAALQFAVTLAFTELSFRLVERPVRSGSAMRRFAEWRARLAPSPSGLGRGRRSAPSAACCSPAWSAAGWPPPNPVDVATGGEVQTFDAQASAPRWRPRRGG